MRPLLAVAMALLAAAAAAARVSPLRQHESAIFCRVVLPQIVGPTIRVRRCRFVRYDSLAMEDLFRVWFTHAGGIYTVCLWSSLDPETAPERVRRVGAVGGTLC